MSLDLGSALSRNRIGQTILSLGVVFLVGAVCHAGEFTLSFPVPPVKDKSGPGGWGAIVLKFDGPVTGGSFVFEPECPEPGDGSQDGFVNPDDASLIQLGPGGYRLLPTGSEVTSPPAPADADYLGEDREWLKVTITYDGDPPPPNLVWEETFWQSKPRPSGVRTWTFDETEGDRYLPEPSTLVLALCAVGFLMKPRRDKSAG